MEYIFNKEKAQELDIWLKKIKELCDIYSQWYAITHYFYDTLEVNNWYRWYGSKIQFGSKCIHIDIEFNNYTKYKSIKNFKRKINIPYEDVEGNIDVQIEKYSSLLKNEIKNSPHMNEKKRNLYYKNGGVLKW